MSALAHNEANSHARQAVLLTPEDRQEFEALESAYAAEIAPSNSVERTQFGQLILAVWNIQRTNRLEAGLAADGIDPLLNPIHEKTLARITIARNRAERTFHQCLKFFKELRAVKNEPKSKPPAEPLNPKPRTPTASFDDLRAALTAKAIKLEDLLRQAATIPQIEIRSSATTA